MTQFRRNNLRFYPSGNCRFVSGRDVKLEVVINDTPGIDLELPTRNQGVDSVNNSESII